MIDKKPSREDLFEVVNKIPSGKVTSYGVVGAVIGISGWEAGRMLSGLPQERWDTVAWQRVVAKNGYISSMKLGFRGQIQKELLLKEGVEIDDATVNMNMHGIDLEDMVKINSQAK